MGEVIKGPWGEQFFQETILHQDDLLDIVVTSLSEEVFDMMRESGFDNLGELVYIKDLALISEAIRAYLMKLQERYHPLQDVSEEFFDINEDLSLDIQPGVHVDFRGEDG